MPILFLAWVAWILTSYSLIGLSARSKLFRAIDQTFVSFNFWRRPAKGLAFSFTTLSGVGPASGAGPEEAMVQTIEAAEGVEAIEGEEDVVDLEGLRGTATTHDNAMVPQVRYRYTANGIWI